MIWVLLIAACVAAAAFAAWRLATKQGRNPMAWTVATVLLAGLPVFALLIRDPFKLPTFGAAVDPSTRYLCCDDRSWKQIADFGHAGGVDLDLGRCENCGAYSMAVFYVSSTTYVVISDEEAERFLQLQGTPALKKALKDWVG